MISIIISFIYEKLGKLNELSLQDNYDFLRDLKIIIDYIITIDFSLKLFHKYVKKIKTFEDFRLFLLHENQDIIINFFSQYTNLLKEESELIENTNNKNKINDNFEKILKLIETTIVPVILKRKNSDNKIENYYYKFICEFLLIRYRDSEEDLKKIIESKIISDNLLLNSKTFIQDYFYYNFDGDNDLIPFYNIEDKSYNEMIFGNFSSFDDNFISSIEKISRENPKIQNTMLIIFEIYITKYFITLDKNLKNEEYINNILNESSFVYFRKAYEIWNKIENNDEKIKYPFLLKLYSLTYIRIYIDRYVLLIEYPNKDFTKIFTWWLAF